MQRLGGGEKGLNSGIPPGRDRQFMLETGSKHGGTRDLALIKGTVGCREQALRPHPHPFQHLGRHGILRQGEL